MPRKRKPTPKPLRKLDDAYRRAMNESQDRQASLAAFVHDGECRICGCTDDDCSNCMARTGGPCAWVNPTLCTACEPHGKLDTNLDDDRVPLGRLRQIEQHNGTVSAAEVEAMVDELLFLRAAHAP